ncbi:MAG TPA: hypothetical protein VFN31_03320 [Candidatus Saccharimonadales bacterium]|nr:hypothetical protein [Candidatus Saccharimonadales bacterium]
MNQITTVDGFLARSPDGEGFALALDELEVGQEAIEVLQKDQIEPGLSEWQVLGRSALGIVTGIDISRSTSPVTCERGSVLVPIDISAHAFLGRKLLPFLHKLMKEHEPAQALRWERHRIPFGRLLWRGGLLRLDNEQLEEALSTAFIAYGEINEDDKFEGDIRIENNAVNMPIEPYQLVPSPKLLSGVYTLQPMLQEGQSARAFAFSHMDALEREREHGMDDMVVSSVLFSPGPYYCEVVRAYSPEGDLPQLPSAAWLDANRSKGLHLEQRPGLRGRQIEVVKDDPSHEHAWPETRVEIKVFQPIGGASKQNLSEWYGSTRVQRTELHYFGYGDGV